MISKHEPKSLTPYLSPLGAWALALGTSIGWGSLVVTSNSYLLQAGPAGSLLGMVIGAIIMIVISRNYHYMINRFPDAGGAYIFAREAFGWDHGFLTAWFLTLTYAAMFWANATSLPLFARFFLGDLFQFGSMYTVFGYHVYLGEILLTAAFIVLIGLVCANFRRLSARLLIVMVLLLSAAITICFLAAIFRFHTAGYSMQPGMIPDKSQLAQVIRIACISPWAFIGFENISHAAEEYTFSRTKVFRILVCAVVSALVLYAFVILLSVTAYPPQYSSWLDYISDLDNLDGIEGLPPFYAARHYLGNGGVLLLLLALLALIFSSLIGNILALSRLLYAMARDGVIPGRLARISSKGTPSAAIFLIAALSLIIPFLGRTAVGWIVDVTTMGATIIYGVVSVSTIRIARREGDSREVRTGLAGTILMILFLLYLLLPNLLFEQTMESESYLLFAVWAILGFLFFRNVLRRDAARHFGRSVIVWIALLALIAFTSLAWMSSVTMTAADDAVRNVHDYWNNEIMQEIPEGADEDYADEQMDLLHTANRTSMVVVTLAFAIALAMLLSNYALIHRRMEESEAELAQARIIANTDPLTGVKSKRALEGLERKLNGSIQADDNFRFAVAACDVNGLKHVNDTLGHKAGDEYICAASRMICELFQYSPVFRTGGDEFTVILTGSDYDKRNDIMRQLHERSAENIGLGQVVVAGGLADYIPGEDKDFSQVFERADALMYEEKAALKELGARTRD